MLDELVNRVAERTGLPPEQARTAAETVIGFLKERLPAPVAGALDGALQDGESSGGMMDQAKGMLGGLGGMFGGANKE